MPLFKRFRPKAWLFSIALLSSTPTLTLANGTGWDEMFSDAQLKRVEADFGKQAVEKVLAWEALIIDAQVEDEQVKLELVNRFMNQMEFISDQDHWQQTDYWATPLEFLATNGGDCEDYSVAKYVTLRMLGVPSEKMRLMYVKSKTYGVSHMVLTYYPSKDDVPLVLDNLEEEILLASERPDLEPVLSFNGDGQWLARLHGRGEKIDNSSGEIWRQIMLRIDKGY